VRPDEAYAEVERLTRKRARNFAYGVMLLPKPKRRAIAAVYAFAREVDDIADDPALPVTEKRERLEHLHLAIEEPPAAKQPVLARGPVEGDRGNREVPQGNEVWVPPEAMLVALADARTQYPIPAKALHDLIDGGLMDTEQQRYATFDELLAYCRRVAGAVGVACVAVYGADQPQRAETLGIALQLINIIRDVAEDWGLGRVYIPQEELASYGVSEEQIAEGRVTADWQALMAYQAARARSFLEDGLTLRASLDARSSACVSTFANLYRATLERIEASGFDVFDGPPHLSALTKLRIVGTGLLP
jgi:phytoene synthase